MFKQLNARKPVVGNTDYPTKQNALIDDLKNAANLPGFPFSFNESTTSGLTLGYFGGEMSVNGVLTTIADGTIALTGSNTNYVEHTAAGVVSKNTTGFSADKFPIAVVVCDAGSITGYTDRRNANSLLIPGRVTFSVAGGAGTTVLTAAQWANDVIEFTGALTGNRTIEVPAVVSRPKVIRNNTTGAFSLTVKTNAGSGKVVTQGKRAVLYCDGTDVNNGADDSLQGSDLVLLGTQIASGASQVDFTNIDGTYDVHILEFTDVTPGTDNQVMNLRVSTDNGASFLSTSIYSYVFIGCSPPSSSYSNGLAAQATMQLTGSNVGNQTGEYVSGSLKFNGLAGATRYKGVAGLMHEYGASPVVNAQMIAGVFLTTTAINALRLYMTSGTISGKFSLYGVKK